MADTTDQQPDEGVRLVSPDGQETTVRNPEAVNNLVYGRGYRLVGDENPEAAVQAATENTSEEDAGGEQTAAPSTPPVTRTSKTTGGAGKTGGGKVPAPSTT